MKATLKQCKDALKQCDGRVALAAKALGMSFQAMYQRMGKHVELQEIAENSREEMIDIAETALKKGPRTADTSNAPITWRSPFLR